MPEVGPEKLISTTSRPPNAKAWTRRRPERPADGPVIGAGSVERSLAITTHAQDGPKTHHFSFDILHLFCGLREGCLLRFRDMGKLVSLMPVFRSHETKPDLECLGPQALLPDMVGQTVIMEAPQREVLAVFGIYRFYPLKLQSLPIKAIIC